MYFYLDILEYVTNSLLKKIFISLFYFIVNIDFKVVSYSSSSSKFCDNLLFVNLLR